MILPVIKLGNPLLRKVAEPFTEREIRSAKTQAFVEDMLETLRSEIGVGLAAPQVGVSYFSSAECERETVVLRLTKGSKTHVLRERENVWNTCEV